VPGAHDHVPDAGHKPIVWPGTCGNFRELRKAHEDACALKVSFPYTDRKTGKTKTRKRAIRRDSHTLYTAVISLPVTSAEALADPERMKDCLRVLRMARSFEAKRLAAEGGELAMCVLHFDEQQVHMHVYGLDRSRGTVNALHPGKAALDDFRARHGALSQKGTNLFQRSKRAYCGAMRGWQDDLHREVFQKAGLMRLGPRRGRLSRTAYVRLKQATEERARLATDLRDVRALRSSVEQIGALFDEREALLDAQEGDLSAREEVLAREAATLADRSESVRAHADANTADAARLAAEKRAVSEARARAKEAEEAARIAAETARRKQVAADARAAKAEAREREADAKLAVAEAFAEGFVNVANVDGKRKLRPTERAARDSRWPALRDKLRAAPEAAGAAAEKISGWMWMLRKRAESKGLEDARKAAQAEVRDKLAAIERAAAGVAGIHAFAKAVIAKLPARPDRQKAEVELARLMKGAANDINVANRRTGSDRRGPDVPE